MPGVIFFSYLESSPEYISLPSSYKTYCSACLISFHDRLIFSGVVFIFIALIDNIGSVNVGAFRLKR